MADSPRRTGRPSAADKQLELIEQVFDRHANGEPLNDVCAALGVKPAEFRHLMRKAAPEVQAEWKLAKEEYVHSLFGEIHSIERKLASGRFGKEDGARVQALRGAIEALKHITGRLNPSQYGEQKSAGPGLTVIINTSLPIGPGQQPAEVLDGDFKVVRQLEASRG